MSRKDYEAIARAIRTAREKMGTEFAGDASTGAQIGLIEVTAEIAAVLAAGNPRFNRARFLAATQPFPAAAKLPDDGKPISEIVAESRAMMRVISEGRES